MSRAMRMRWIERGLILVLSFLILGDAALVVYLKNSGFQSEARLILRDPSSQGTFVPPVGFGSCAGVGEDQLNSHGYQGWAVRYSSNNCPFCKKDEALWNPLESGLREIGYRVFIIVPNTQDEFPPNSDELNGARQEVYVSLGWIKHFRLTVTPTLLLFNHRGELIWSHQGMLDPIDPSSALQAAKRYSNAMR